MGISWEYSGNTIGNIMKSSEIIRQERLESDLKMGPAWVKIEG